MQYGLGFVYAILIFIVGKWLARLFAKGAGMAMAKGKLNETLASFLKNIIYYTLLIFVCIAALNKIGILKSAMKLMLVAHAG
jgi:small conductance mechanosensitive channel